MKSMEEGMSLPHEIIYDTMTVVSYAKVLTISQANLAVEKWEKSREIRSNG